MVRLDSASATLLTGPASTVGAWLGPAGACRGEQGRRSFSRMPWSLSNSAPTLRHTSHEVLFAERFVRPLRPPPPTALPAP